MVSGQGNQKAVRGKQDESRREMKLAGDRIILLNREKVRRMKGSLLFEFYSHFCCSFLPLLYIIITSIIKLSGCLQLSPL